MFWALILILLVVVGLVVAFAAFVAFWILAIVFGISTIGLALLVGDPYLGFFLAFPVTAVLFACIGLYTNRPPES